MPNKDTKYHDAAYDAFVMGKCFAIMAQHVGRKAEPPVKNLASSSKLLTPFINKQVMYRGCDVKFAFIDNVQLKGVVKVVPITIIWSECRLLSKFHGDHP